MAGKYEGENISLLQSFTGYLGVTLVLTKFFVLAGGLGTALSFYGV